MQAASINDHEVIRLLLEYGANINARRRFYPTSLYAASVRGQRGMVRLLLDKGAGVNSGGRYYGNVLQAALANGQQAVVQLLLDEGAEFDKFGGHYCNIQQAANALKAASYRGHRAVDCSWNAVPCQGRRSIQQQCTAGSRG